MEWSPAPKIVFSDEELIDGLAASRDRPEARVGNWWTFFSTLPRPEQLRLEAEAAGRQGYRVPAPVEAADDGEVVRPSEE